MQPDRKRPPRKTPHGRSRGTAASSRAVYERRPAARPLRLLTAAAVVVGIVIGSAPHALCRWTCGDGMVRPEATRCAGCRNGRPESPDAPGSPCDGRCCDTLETIPGTKAAGFAAGDYKHRGAGALMLAVDLPGPGAAGRGRGPIFIRPFEKAAPPLFLLLEHLLL